MRNSSMNPDRELNKTCARNINEPMAYQLRGLKVNNITSCRGSARPLPATLVIPPGTYRVHSRAYRLTKEGLYRFMHPGTDNQQRIVFKNDPLAFLSALSWLSAHGNRDNGKTIPDKIRIAMRGKLIVTCGDMSAFGQHLLARHDIPARVVHVRTLEGSNNYDMGHVLTEIQLGGKWTLADLDVKYLFRRGGRRLSLLEAVEAVAKDDYQLEPLAQAVNIAVANFTGKEGYDYGLWMETWFYNQAAVRKWYRRIMMLPIISQKDGPACSTVYPLSRLKKARILWKNLDFLPRNDFISKFYKDEKDCKTT